MEDGVSGHTQMVVRWGVKFFLIGTIFMFLAIGISSGCAQQTSESKKEAEPQKAVEAVSPPAPARAAKSIDFARAIEWVAERTIPAVVHIEVTERQEVINPLLPFQEDPFFRHFFGFPEMPRKFKRELKGLGTGMIMDAEGHILTNNHVAGGATKIEVLLANGKRYPAKLVGADPKT
ncbi:MAG: trypsin-like peptidase domain-containing protein, partial [Deltaproteobacteria bacterium]|nr:trypsin-like peptidase domain-containing protein [Deltaproteobacteria bacterium]